MFLELTVKDIQRMLRERNNGLDESGTKAQLWQRLQEDIRLERHEMRRLEEATKAATISSGTLPTAISRVGQSGIRNEDSAPAEATKSKDNNASVVNALVPPHPALIPVQRPPPVSGNSESRFRCPDNTCRSKSHLGRYGAAGLAIIKRDPLGNPTHVVLQKRHDDTWCLPGGVLENEEEVKSPWKGAIREAKEETGIEDGQMTFRDEPYDETNAPFCIKWSSCRHWEYTTWYADSDRSWEPRKNDEESAAMEFVELEAVDQSRILLPAFAESWPDIKRNIPRISNYISRTPTGACRL